jgi:hypothetical protein
MCAAAAQILQCNIEAACYREAAVFLKQIFKVNVYFID